MDVVKQYESVSLCALVFVLEIDSDMLLQLLKLNDDVFVVVFEDERIAVAEKDGRGVKLAL